MNASVIEGEIKFKLLILDDSKLDKIESSLAGISAQELFDFLPQSVVVQNFAVNQNVAEVFLNVIENSPS